MEKSYKKLLIQMKIILVLFFLLLVNTEIFGQETQQKFQGFNLQGYTENGEKSWDVNGKTADIEGSKVIISEVDANAYGDQKVNVTAEKGIIDQSSGNMELEKDVVITSEQGSQLLTDSLNWDRKNDIVTTNDDVLIKDEKYTATGKGMKSQPGLKNAEILEDVTVKVNTESDIANKKILTITCDGPMVVDQAISKATFIENVVAVQDNQTLKADKMEVYFFEEMDGIEKVICSGNVSVVQGENKSYADLATYDAKTKKLTLSGRPKLILLTEGENAITTIGD